MIYVKNKIKTFFGFNLLGQMKKEEKYFAINNYNGSINLKEVLFTLNKYKDKYYFSASSECSNPLRCNGRLTLFTSKKYKNRIDANSDMSISVIQAFNYFKDTTFLLPNYNKDDLLISWDKYIDGEFVEVSLSEINQNKCMACFKVVPENGRICPHCGEPYIKN